MDYEFHDYDYEDEYSPLDGSGDRRKTKKKKKPQFKKSVRLPPLSDTTYRTGSKSSSASSEKRRACCSCLGRCFNCWTVAVLLSTLWSTWLTLWLVNTYLLGSPSSMTPPRPSAGESGAHTGDGNAQGGGSLDSDAYLVKIPLEMAQTRGAFCLDGSEPAFYHRPGKDGGASSWILHLPDGQWCYNASHCLDRSRTPLGSSSNLPSSIPLSQGILSNDPEVNPNFFDWNVVQLHYCDGSSFSSTSQAPLSVLDDAVIYQRGSLILDTVIAFLLNSTDLSSAERVIFSGTGSGGLGVYMQADRVRSLLPEGTTYHALADSAFYPDVYNISNNMHIRIQFQKLYNLHHIIGSLDKDCLQSKLVLDPSNTWQCMFPQCGAKFIQSPLFISNSMHDPWSLWFLLNVRCYYEDCPELTPAVLRYGGTVLQLLAEAGLSHEDGVYVTSCYEGDLIGRGWNHVNVGGVSTRDAFGNWYFDRSSGERGSERMKRAKRVADDDDVLDEDDDENDDNDGDDENNVISTNDEENIDTNLTHSTTDSTDAVAVTVMTDSNKQTTTAPSKVGKYWYIDCTESLICNDMCMWSKKYYEQVSEELEEMCDFFILPVSDRVKRRRRPRLRL